MANPRRSLSLAEVISFYVMKTTSRTDPNFFRADDEYHRDIDALGFEVAPWKKVLGEVYYHVVGGWLDRRLGEKRRARDEPQVYKSPQPPPARGP